VSASPAAPSRKKPAQRQALEATPRRYGGLTLAADYIGVSEKTIRRMIAAGEITGYRFGKRLIRVDLAELDAMMHPIPSAKG
jgi:excisionase family DNA binding protein